MEDAYLGGFLHALEKAIFLVLAAAKRVFVFVIVRTVGDAQTVADGFFGYCLSMGRMGKILQLPEFEPYGMKFIVPFCYICRILYICVITAIFRTLLLWQNSSTLLQT